MSIALNKSGRLYQRTSRALRASPAMLMVTRADPGACTAAIERGDRLCSDTSAVGSNPGSGSLGNRVITRFTLLATLRAGSFIARRDGLADRSPPPPPRHMRAVARRLQDQTVVSILVLADKVGDAPRLKRPDP
jgi:hypothetical protein